jgi:hypothetical protein
MKHQPIDDAIDALVWMRSKARRNTILKSRLHAPAPRTRAV